MFDYQVINAHSPKARLILAHGAGAGMDHPFMQDVAKMLAEQHVEVVLFNFPYMQTMQETGKRRPPDKAEKLTAHFISLAEHLNATLPSLPVFIGGKSMGGRMATMVCNDIDCLGVVVYGYPFHPPGKPDQTRLSHFPDMTVPVEIIQGERDTFGNRADIAGYSLAPHINVTFLDDGDHSFKPRKASGMTQQSHIQQAARLTADFITNGGSS